MLPKAVLSLLGRAVGIAAVVVSPLAAQAAESSDAQKSTVVKPASTHVHRHKGDKRAKKRGARHGEGKDEASSSAPNDRETRAKESREAKDKSASSHADDEVTTERASAKNPPKPSSTPLPSLAAAATRPLVEPIATKSEIAIEPKAHAVEPRRTPIVRASHVESLADGPSAPEASARQEKRERHAKPPCLHAPVNVTRGSEEQTLSLTRCDGSALPSAIDALSILVRPENAAKPSGTTSETSKTSKDEVAPGIKKIDERLVERLELMVDHFAKPAATPKIFVVSGYRPASKGSFHAMGKAIDFRVSGVENTDLVAFCKTLPDTGCGFYPNSSFIHVDVREAGAGHVSWIDASGPGEKPEYVASWPPPPAEDGDAVKLLAKLDELQLLPAPGEHERKPENAKTEVRAEPSARVETARSETPVAPADHAEPASLTRSLEDE